MWILAPSLNRAKPGDESRITGGRAAAAGLLRVHRAPTDLLLSCSAFICNCCQLVIDSNRVFPGDCRLGMGSSFGFLSERPLLHYQQN